MSIFVYAENISGFYKKATFEAVSYAKEIAEKFGDSLTAIAINSIDSSDLLYKYGADKVIKVQDECLKSFNAKAYAQIIDKVVEGDIIIFPHTTNASSIAPMLAISRKSSLITNVITTPNSIYPFEIKRKAFSGKAFMNVKVESKSVVVTISQNVFEVKEKPVLGFEEVKILSISNADIEVINYEESLGKFDLNEAEIVVSGGRGMKGPENWGIIEDFAQVLGAATANSKPVSDMGWRPHCEHVGQTGKSISPNLYIAIGISGAIQHIAGVSNSKKILVINNDPEAPFFKEADYGVVGDAFQILPTLTKKIKAFKCR